MSRQRDRSVVCSPLIACLMSSLLASIGGRHDEGLYRGPEAEGSAPASGANFKNGDAPKWERWRSPGTRQCDIMQIALAMSRISSPNSSSS